MHTPDYKYEIPDQTPVEMPIGYERPEPLEQMIARMVRTFSDTAKQQGAESFEEADDFDVDDDSELVSPYQMSDMQEENPYVQTRRKPNPDTQNAGPKKATSEEPAKPVQKDTPTPQETLAQK